MLEGCCWAETPGARWSAAQGERQSDEICRCATEPSQLASRGSTSVSAVEAELHCSSWRTVYHTRQVLPTRHIPLEAIPQHGPAGVVSVPLYRQRNSASDSRHSGLRGGGHMNRTLRTLVAALVLLFPGLDASAQTTAQINGTVVDESGGVAAGRHGHRYPDRHRLSPGRRHRRRGSVHADEPADRTLSPRSHALRLPHLRADRNRAAGEQQSGDSREAAAGRARGNGVGRGGHAARRDAQPLDRSSHRQRGRRGAAARGSQRRVSRRPGWRCGRYRQSLEPQPDSEPRHRGRRRPAVRRAVSARRRDAQQLVRRRQPAVAVSRRDAGVPRGDQLAERAERRQGGRHGQRRDQGGHEPVPRRRVRVRAPPSLQREGAVCGGQSGHRRAGQRRPGTKPVRRRAGRADRPGQDLLLRRLSGHPHHADPRRHRHVHSDGGDAQRRLLDASPRRSAARRGTSRCRRRSDS